MLFLDSETSKSSGDSVIQWVDLGVPQSIPAQYKIIYTGWWTANAYNYLHVRLEGDVHSRLIWPSDLIVKFTSNAQLQQGTPDTYDITLDWNGGVYVTSTVSSAKSRISYKITTTSYPYVSDYYIKYADTPGSLGAVILQCYFPPGVNLTLVEGLTAIPSGLTTPYKANIISSTIS